MTCFCFFLFFCVLFSLCHYHHLSPQMETFKKFFKKLLFFKTLHSNPKIIYTKCKIPHISCKMKHFDCIQNITNTSQKQTFVLRRIHLCHNIIFFGVYTGIQNLKLFFHELCTFLYKIESNWQRYWKHNFSSSSFILFFFTVSICGCENRIALSKNL